MAAVSAWNGLHPSSRTGLAGGALPLQTLSALPHVVPRGSVSVKASSGSEGNEGPAMARREVMAASAALVATAPFLAGPALAGKLPKGFSAHSDNVDNYAFLFPFGWQEVQVKGQDVVFKDVIEPLESVSVNIIKTDTTSLAELGSPQEVAATLVEKVLSSPTQKIALIDAKERETDGKKYYTFEFVTQAPNFKRHGLGVVGIAYGKFYTLTTGANERRWDKVQEKLRVVADSFQTL